MVAALPSPPPSGTPQVQPQHQQQHQHQHHQHVFHEQPAQPDSKGNVNGEVLRRPRSREITSRYKTATNTPAPVAPPTPARRYPSPAIGRTSTGGEAPKRAASAERRRSESPGSRGSNEGKASSSSGSSSRPGTPRALSRTSSGNTELRAPAQRLWPSTHNLSTSLQLDHTLKPAENGIRRGSGVPTGGGKVADRKGTPERKRTPVRRPTTDQTENARPVDNSGVKPDVHRWPVASSPKALSRSVDLSAEREKLGGRMSGVVVQGRGIAGTARQVKRTPPIKSLSKSINEGPLPDSPQSVSRHMLSASRSVPRGESSDERDDTASTVSEAPPPSDILSDCESLSSAGTVASSGSAQKKTPAKSRRLPQGDIVGCSLGEQDFSAATKSARRLRSLTLSSPTAGVTSGRLSTGSSPTAAGVSSARFSSGSQPPSPSRMLASSPFRSMPSPTRTRASPFQLPPSGHSRAGSISSLLHFPLDVRKGKKAMSQLEEAHYLRILHNRWLQWRYVNARSDAARTAQKAIAEWSIYNAWQETQQLRKSVAMKRTNLQKTNRTLKLRSMLAAQGPQLENWAALQDEHSEALSGAMEALEAAVLRVPVTAGARADVQAIREALWSAVDVMGSVESSVVNLLPKTKHVDALVSELSEVSKQGKTMLEECSTLLKTVAALEVEETSLRTHFVQLEREKSRQSIQLRTTTTSTPAKPC